MARSESRLIALQTLVFVIGKHWSKLASDVQLEIRRTLILLLSDDSEILQSWAYIALSTVVLSSRAEDSQSQDDWQQVWNVALQKCHLPGTSRSASHAAAILLQFNMLDSTLTIKGIQTLLTSIAVQGPPTVHDSVCALYAVALDIARSDIQLYSLDLEEQVLSWLEKVLAGEKFERDYTQRRFGDQTATPGDVLRLFSAVSRIQRHHDVPLAEPVTRALLPDSAVVEYALERAKTRPIRDFLLYHTYPPTPQQPPTPPQPPVAPSSDHSTFLDRRPRRLSDLLSRILDVTIAQWESTNSNPVIISSDTSGERLGRSINLLVLALGFQGLVQLDGYIPHAGCVKAAIRLLHLLKPSLTSSDISMPSLDRVWRGLTCLVDVELQKQQQEEEEWPILVKPDVQSGIRQDLLPPIMYDTPPHPTESPSRDRVSVSTKQVTQFPLTFPSTSTSTHVAPSSFSTFQNHASPASASASLVHAIWRLPDVSLDVNCPPPGADSRS